MIQEVLLHRWQSSNVTIQPPATTEMINRFERENSVILPNDFIDYLKFANGFIQSKNYQDSKGFNFLPLEDLFPVSKWDGGVSFFNHEFYFVFCDYMDRSWVYALRLDGIKDGEVVLVGTRNGLPQAVSETFSEFIKLYLADDEAIYPRL